jgi:repressor LexA
MPVTLTTKQGLAMRFIQSTIDRTGTAPSFDEIKDYLGLRSKSGVHRLVTALEQRGYIDRVHHAARAIEVLHRVVDVSPPGGPPICPTCRRPMTSH